MKGQDDLLCCPSCKYTEEHYKQNLKKWGVSHSQWDKIKPQSYRDRLTRQWVIECPNCQMTILFRREKEVESIDLWNNLPR